MKPIEIENLDQHLRPLQVDGISTGIEISTEGLRFTGGTFEVESLITNKTDHEGDLTVHGDLYLQDTDGSTIYLANEQSIDSKSTNDYITINTRNILVNTAIGMSGADSDCKLFLASDGAYDSQISFMEGAGVNWSIGNDGGEATSTLSFSSSAVLGSNERMSLDTNGLLTVGGDIVAGDDIAVAATGKLSLDGIDGHTYIHEDSDDSLTFVVGTDTMLNLTAGTSSLNKADFGSTAVGMTQASVIYNASDTDVYFSRAGNKQFLTFGSGNITDMNLIFPDMSGNFVLLLKQDGTGSRTVTNWKTFDQVAGNESTVKWAGGSAPTLTTTASKTDILSFYWDNANHVAYGVATLNF